MSANHTYAQIAADFELWGEYFDTGSEMTEAEFDALSIEKKVALQVEAFGPDKKIIVDGEVFDLDAARNLMDDELCEQIHGTVETDQEFVDAYLVAHKAKFDEDFTVN